MTAEQRAAALEKAAAARKARAELKANIKAGKVAIADVLNSDDDVVKKTKVAQIIGSVPGIGKAKTEDIMKELKIDASRRVGGLGSRQKEALIAKLG